MNITVSGSGFDHLRKLAKECGNTRPMMAAGGKALEVGLRAHFAMLEAKGNKKGWPSQNFWSHRVRDKTALTEVTEHSATVSIASPELMHKITGGTITPKRGKTLAIPANAEAAKLGSPREADADQLMYLPLNQGNLVGALLRTFQTQMSIRSRTLKDGSVKRSVVKGREVGGEVWYWLVRSVTHKAQSDALPPPEELSRAVFAKMRETLDLQFQAK